MAEHPVTAILDRCLELRLVDPRAALAEIERARRLPLADPPVDIEPFRFSLDAAEAACLRNLGENDDAREIAESVLERAPSDDHYALSSAHLVLGITDLAEGAQTRAIESLQKALEYGEKDGSSRLQASILNILGGGHVLRGELRAAEEALRRAILIAPLDSQLIPLASATLGSALSGLGDYEGALHAYAKALAGHQSVGHRRGIAWALHNLAATYANLERWQSAEEASAECLAMLAGTDGGTAIEDRELPSYAHGLRGRIENSLGNHEAARTAFSVGREFALPIEDRAREARCLRGLGECDLLAGNPEASLAHLEAAASLLDPEEHPRDTIELEIEIARALLGLGRIDEASERFSAILERAEAAEHVETVIVTLRLGAEIAEQRGNFAEALEFERRRFRIREQAQEVASRQRFEQSSLANQLERSRYREELLRSARDELETRVVERTSDLERANAELRRGLEERARAEEERRTLEEQLHHAQRMESIGRMAAGVSHDLNNILSVILGCGDHLLRSELATEKQKRSVDLIITAAERASTMMRQLLTFSLRQPHDRSYLDLASVLTDLEPMLRSILPAQVTLEIERVGRPKVDADRTQIEQVILNLVINARDAIQEKGRIVIRAETITDGVGNRRARISVGDNGIGIPADDVDRVFEPYFTTKTPGAGTGLGLSTVYGIVRQHEGTIEVESTVGRGTTLRATFPLLGELDAALDVEPSPPIETTDFLELAVVEGDADLRAMLAANLRDLGHRVHEIASARTLFEPTDEHRTFDVIISPLVLSEMTGIELLGRVRRHAPHQRFLFTSGHLAARVVLPERCGFLAKPFRLSDLCEKLQSLFAQR